MTEPLTAVYSRADGLSPKVSSTIMAAGTAVVLILYGQSTLGGFLYFRQYPKDGYGLKFIIGALLAFDTLHAAFIAHIYCNTVIAHPCSDLSTTVVELWSYQALPMMTTMPISIAYIFFIRRVYGLCHPSKWFLPTFSMMTLSAYVLIIFHTIYVFVNPSFRDSFRHTTILFGAQMIAVLGNIFLTIRLVLYFHKSRTGIKRTNNLLNNLILFAVNSGICTGVLTIMTAILLVCTPGLVYYPLACLTPPVHTIFVLAAVNSRRSLVDRGSEGVEIKTCDLDIAPGPKPNTTIQWARPEGSALESGIGVSTNRREQVVSTYYSEEARAPLESTSSSTSQSDIDEVHRNDEKVSSIV